MLDEVPDAIEVGVPAFKMFTAYKIGLSNGFMNWVIKRLTNKSAIGVIRTEDTSVCEDLVAQFEEEGKSDAPTTITWPSSIATSASVRPYIVTASPPWINASTMSPLGVRPLPY